MPSFTISSATLSYTISADNFALTNLSKVGTPSVAITVTGNDDTIANVGTIQGQLYGISATSGLSLTNAAGALVIGGDYGVYAGTSASAIVNFGSIGGVGGIRLEYISSITNQAGGRITGTNNAINLVGGTILNVGSGGLYPTISGGSYGIIASGAAVTVTNSGSIYGGDRAIRLDSGGNVTNLAGGTIDSDGVAVQIATGTVINGGSISAMSTGVEIKGGAASLLSNQSGGVISSSFEGVGDDQGVVINDGRIIGGVFIYGDGSLTNNSGGTIQGSYGIDVSTSASIINFGTITGSHTGVELYRGGTLTNASGAVIAGGNGVSATGTAAIYNAGSISGASGGVVLSQGYLTNQATGIIKAGSNADGVMLFSNATLLNAGGISGATGLYAQAATATNQSGGIISGGTGVALGLAGTLINAGRVTAAMTGITLLGTATVINQTGGTIYGGASAGVAAYAVQNFYYNFSTGQIYFLGYEVGHNTVVNSGLISGTYGVTSRDVGVTIFNHGTIEGSKSAIQFAADYSSKLVMYPGALIEGSVQGGFGTLEFASGSGAGTLSATGTQFGSFEAISVDAGADWAFTGSNTFAASANMTIAGTVSGMVAFGADFDHQVLLTPDASVTGTIDGGNPIGGTNRSDLILTAGSTAGTLNGFGSNFIDFGQIYVNAGAYWTLNPGTLPSGLILNSSGTVGATSGVSVRFLPGSGNRVVLAAGADFLGTVDGGNTIGSTAASVLELSFSASPSTLSGLGSKYVNFSQIDVDGGTYWYFLGDTFAAGTTLTNAGTVSGANNTAVSFAAGADNLVILKQSGVFVGTVDGGNAAGSSFTSTLELTSNNSTGKLSGLGTQFVNFAQITVDPGAYWYFSGVNTVTSSALTIDGEIGNSSTLTGNVTLAGGTMLNNLGGVVAGEVLGVGAAATLFNRGTIEGTGGTAVQLAAGFANAVELYQGASFGGVVNGNAPTLAALYLGTGGSAGTLVGFGSKYIGFGQIVVTQNADWSLGNTTTLGAGITLTNDGTVFGIPDAVRFAPGAGNRVVIESNGTFSGTVDGGNPIGGPNTSTLELAAGGFLGGTLSGIGSQFIDFAQITVDAGATWLFTTGLNTLASGVTLDVAGYLGIDGRMVGNVTLTDGGRFGVYQPGNSVTGSIVGITSSDEVIDSGLIKGVGLDAVDLTQGGVVNVTTAAAQISGAAYGVQISGQPGTVINNGYVVGSKVGIALAAGGTVANYGFINGGKTIGGAGVWLQDGGTALVWNGVSITGFIGVKLDGPSTLFDRGIINGGTGGEAVQFSAGAPQHLIVYPGAVFRGTVDGGNIPGSGTVSTLELASGASTGTLSGLGSKYINFGSIVIDANAHWTLTGSNTIESGSTFALNNTYLSDAGTLVNNGGIALDPSTMVLGGLTGTGITNIGTSSGLEVQGGVGAGSTITFDGVESELGIDSPGSFSGTVTGLGPFDSIYLKGVNPASVSYNLHTVSFTPPGGGTAEFSLTAAPGYTLMLPASSDGAGDTLLYAASTVCFGAGTHIGTPKGEIPVERLRVGDMVLTTDGSIQPVVWIGTGRVMVPHGRRSAATPVIVRKGAIARNVPHRDLHLTKGHSLCIDNVLIPVEFLVNHRSIVWNDAARELTIYHIELGSHAVLLAEGAPAESYRDDGNRWLFENANSGWNQPPQEPCLPVLTGGPIVDAVWWRLFHRAGPRLTPPITCDADLHLMADGIRVNDEGRTDGLYVFRLLCPPRTLRVVSRSAAPDELGLARDARRLGVALRKIMIWQGRMLHAVDIDDAALRDGFHTFEPAEGLRWTDGNAQLPASLFAGFNGPLLLELHVVMTARYPVDGAAERAT